MKKIAKQLFFVLLMVNTISVAQMGDSTAYPKLDPVISKKSEKKASAESDSLQKSFYLKSALTITSKGISYIPNLSLGKPAVLFDLNLRNEKLSFEPQLRFSINGDPWAFLFPVRYKINPKGKFQITAGINPLMNFKEVTYTVNNVTTTELAGRRYLGGECRLNYFFTKHISVGAQYMYFGGVSVLTAKNTHFVAVKTNFSRIQFAKNFFAQLASQVYYLNQDGNEGYYFNASVLLRKKDFPFSIESIINTAIQTTIPANDSFIWNVSLIYAFERTYLKKDN